MGPNLIRAHGAASDWIPSPPAVQGPASDWIDIRQRVIFATRTQKYILVTERRDWAMPHLLLLVDPVVIKPNGYSTSYYTSYYENRGLVSGHTMYQHSSTFTGDRI